MTKAQILVVEDEAIVAEDIASYLIEMGYFVIDVVASGKHAIATAKQTHPDLILMDIMLQGRMDGIETARLIQNELSIPIVYLTANADETTLQRITESNAFGYILKPFKEQELRAAIAIALSRHQAEMRIQKALVLSEECLQQAAVSSTNNTVNVARLIQQLYPPLLEIQTSMQALQEDMDSLNQKQQQQVQSIHEATQLMRQLLNDALASGQVK